MDALFRQPPKKAIEYLQQKQVMPSQDWFEVQGNAHNKAFVIAHMTQMDLLQDIKQSLLDAQAKGIHLKDWSAQAEQLMRAKGWWGKKEITTADGTREVQLGSPYRLKTIYQTNMAQAYEAGRQSVMWNDQDTLFPYVMYSAILDNKTRPRHRALHGVVMLKTDPAWQAIAPKNGYNCRCTVIELMQADVTAGGYKVRSSQGFFRIDTVDVANGGVAQVARLEFPDLPAFATDAGWVGRPTDSPLGLFFEKAVKVDAKIAAQSAAQVLQNRAVVNGLNDEVKGWIESIDVSKPRGEMRHVGAFNPIFVDAIQKHSGIQLETAVITIHDKDTIAHIAKERKTHDPEWFKNIVAHLNEPHDLYWDVRHNNAALVFDLNDDTHKYKLIIQLNRQNKGRMDRERVNYLGNLIRTIVVEETLNFQNGQDYILLKKFDEKD